MNKRREEGEKSMEEDEEKGEMGEEIKGSEAE